MAHTPSAVLKRLPPALFSIPADVGFYCVCVCVCVLVAVSVCLTLEFKDSLVCAASGCSCLYPSGVYLRSSSTITNTVRYTHMRERTHTHTQINTNTL